MSTLRYYHAATLLADGRVLITGGEGIPGSFLASAELYDPSTGTFTLTGSLTAGRLIHTATLLANGKVLVTGGVVNPGDPGDSSSAELYDPTAGTFTLTGSLAATRIFHTATLLASGKVLITGGEGNGFQSSAELYDPTTGIFTPTGSLVVGREAHTATLLANGKVLVTGGYDGSFLSTAELYDPGTGLFSRTGSLDIGRRGHTATLLTNGKVLITGGERGYRQFLSSAELYDPGSGTFTPAGTLTVKRYHHTATLLANDQVLITGGFGGGGGDEAVGSTLSSAELYDAATGAFTPTGSLGVGRLIHTATLLPNRQVLIAGGGNTDTDSVLSSAELYDPGQCTAVVIYPPPMTSGDCSEFTIAYTPSSGSTFPVGTTIVACTATDAHGVVASTSNFMVTVNCPQCTGDQDIENPTITCPPNQSAPATSPNGAIVNYPAPNAGDNCPGVTILCNPPSGSTFPIGDTLVTCTATDAAGNQTSCAFTVTVTDRCSTVVSNTNDSGPGSLRAAIECANSNPGLDAISFNIPGSGPHTIAPASELPTITDPVIIDGTTQPGFAGVPIVELDGRLQSFLQTAGVAIHAGNSIVRGLAIKNFDTGINIQSADNCQIEGNYIQSNVHPGVVIEFSHNNIIGGTGLGSRNVISGNDPGIIIATGSGNLVQGNFIGTDAAGTGPLRNLEGIVLLDAPGTIIGGTIAGARNIISGNRHSGIVIASEGRDSGNGPGILVEGNYIGTDVSGIRELGNGAGILIDKVSNVTIGGDTPEARNIISGNQGDGVQITGVRGAHSNRVNGNFIGTDKDGLAPLGNRGDAVFIAENASNNRIGNNIIAFNGGTGVSVNARLGNVILGNSIFANSALGIDLGADGVTLNDPGDGDTGANNLQNFPVLIAAASFGGTTTIQGTLNSSAFTPFTIQFFGNPACDPSGFGEGQTFIGSTAVTTDGDGNTSFNVALAAATVPCDFITATATDPDGNTSEFSQCIQVDGSIVITCPADVITPNDPGQCSAVVNYPPPIVSEPSATPICSPPSGSSFPVGTTVVNCTVTNACGNTAGCSFNVTVQNVENPTITCPPNQSVAATSPDGAVVTYPPPTAGNNCPGVTVVCSPLSGSTFPIGNTVVTCTATDAASNQATCTFTVTVTAGCSTVVSNTNDSGPGSLRAALECANSNPGVDTISFNIPGPGPHTIHLLSPLPALIGDVLDGTTQPGFAGRPIVELDGSAAELFANGLVLASSDSVVRGLVINRFEGAGIFVGSHADRCRIEGNFIGTDLTGTIALGNSISPEFGGIVLETTHDCIIGGTTTAARNVISGNSFFGISMQHDADRNIVQGNFIGTDVTGTLAVGEPPHGAIQLGVFIERGFHNIIGGTTIEARNVISGNEIGITIPRVFGNIIQGNFIGTDANGTNPVGNVVGIRLADALGNTIGGTTAGSRNIISGNANNAITFDFGDGTGTVVQGNYIGTDVTGTKKLGNGISFPPVFGTGGIVINGTSNVTIGGDTPEAGNLISGNGSDGIQIVGFPPATGNRVEGNLIGTDKDGLAPLGNTRHGVLIAENAADNRVGGTTYPEGNIIAFNGGTGVSVKSGIGNAILGNSIFANADLGIDLGADGITPNDPGDGDTGANNLQNFPVLTSIISDGASAGGNTTIVGSLNSAPNTNFRIEFFANDACDPLGFGEGQRFIGAGTANTSASGNENFRITFPGTLDADEFVTATATDPNGNTSEFSQCAQVIVTGGCSTVVSNTNDSGPGSLRAAINCANAQPGLDTISFNIPGPGPHTISPTSVLPTINDPVILDGTTQPGFAGKPIIEINGANVSVGSGLLIVGGSSTIRGLAMNRFNTTGIALFGLGGNVIQGNFIGTDVNGTIAMGNSQYGVYIDSTSPVNLIGGTNLNERNVISGNGVRGIQIGSMNNRVQGNYIGTDLTGTISLENSSEGIVVFGSNNSIGGNLTGAGNVISGNGRFGVRISRNASGNVVAGNFIGTDHDGLVDLGNGQHGIFINQNASNNIIGGTSSDARNIIAFNGGDGISVGSSGKGNALLSNSIFANTGLGIDLDPDGVTINDPGDGDFGPNNLQNFPVLSSAASFGGVTTIRGSLNSAPNTRFTIQFFANQACDSTGFGEGQTFIGSTDVTTESSGNARFRVTLAATVPRCAFVTATATDPDGNTSEFSQCVQVQERLTITCPLDIIIGTDPNECSARVNYPPPTVSDPSATVVCSPPSGSIFPLGTTVVICTATNACGSSIGCSFSVTVQDTERPTIACSRDIVQPADPGRCDAVVSFDVTALDNCRGATLVCVPPAGSTFPIGTTMVTCTATDAAGNTAVCIFNVTINSTRISFSEDLTGLASASAVADGYSACGGFDDDLRANPFEHTWLVSQVPAWLQYDFRAGQEKIIQRYRINSNIEGYHPNSWTFEGSNDPSSWTILDMRSGVTDWGDPSSFLTFDFNNTTAYRYYRINISVSQASGAAIGELQLDDLTGVASASAVADGYSACGGFDDDLRANPFEHAWLVSQVPAWLQYDFRAGQEKIIQRYRINSNIEGYHPNSWTFEGSNDASFWTILDMRSGVTDWGHPTSFLTFDFNNTTAYRYYRINISVSQSSGAAIGELDLIAKICP